MWVTANSNRLYDSLDRLTNLTHNLGGSNLLASYSYQLHSTGRRTNAVEILKQEDGAWLTNTLSWADDQMYRLTNEVSISSAPSNGGTYTNAFQYDKVGNRSSKTHYQNGSTTTVTNFYNANDQLIREVTLSGGVATATNWYAYDANGSMIARTNLAGTTTMTLYGYDLKNKLVSAAQVGTGSTKFFVYNDQSIRVRSTVAGVATHFLIDANNHTGYAQTLEELGTPGATASMSYVLGDDVIAQVGSSPSYLLYDGHGSTRQLASKTGALSSRYNYDAYGETLATSTQNPNPVTSLLYCGEQYDPDLEMYNLRARYYNRANGRFNQRDTFVGYNEDPQSLHKYAYAKCDPVTNIDPSGHDGISINLGGILLVTAIMLTLALAVLPKPGLRPYTGPVIWIRGSEATRTGTEPMPRPRPDPEGYPPPLPWPDPFPKPDRQWGFYIHYSAKPPPEFQFGIMLPPRAWVTDILNSGLDAETAYQDFGLFVRPKYEYLFRIHRDMLGPPDNNIPGRQKGRVQYEVLSPTGPGSLITWRGVPAH